MSKSQLSNYRKELEDRINKIHCGKIGTREKIALCKLEQDLDTVLKLLVS